MSFTSTNSRLLRTKETHQPPIVEFCIQITAYPHSYRLQNHVTKDNEPDDTRQLAVEVGTWFKEENGATFQDFSVNTINIDKH